MKYIMYLFAIIVFPSSGNLFSQSILERENYFIQGHLYPYQRLNNIKYDSVAFQGNGITWDFSSATSSGTFDTLFTPDPAGTIFFNDPGVNYYLSNLCLYYPGGIVGGIDDSLYNYFISTPDSVKFLGTWAYNGIWELWWYHLTDAELYFKFPFSYTDSVADSLLGSAYDMSGFGQMIIQGQRTIVYDGYGTLVLPGITYSNCIRIKSHRTVIYVGIWGSMPVSEIYYYWFSDSLNGPVLELRTYSNTVQESIHYFENPSVGIKDPTGSSYFFRLSPNPALDVLKIETNFDVPKAFKVEIFDLSGRMIQFQTSVEQFVQLDITDLSKGMYLVKAITNENHTCSKFVKQ